MTPSESRQEFLKVQVWIFAQAADGNRQFLLLLTRPERGGFWQPVTGSVETGESLMDAAFREAKEETSLTFTSLPFSLEKDFIFEARGRKFHEYGFALQAQSLKPPVLDPHEHTDFCWVSAQEAFHLLKHPSNRNMLQTLLRESSMQGK